MTYGEVSRANDAYVFQLQTQASLHYQLANLIGISVGRILNKKVQMPELEEAYPTLFNTEKAKQERQEAVEQREIAGFMALVEQHNTKIDAR